MVVYLSALCSEPAKAQTAGRVAPRDTIKEKFQQNELNFEADPEKVMEANAALVTNMIKGTLAKDNAKVDLEKSSAEELARVGFLNLAYANDYDRASELLIHAANGGNATSMNFLGAMMYYSGNLESADKFILLAQRMDPYYLPALYNMIMIQIKLYPNPGKDVVKLIRECADLFYRSLAGRCDPEKPYSFPDYRMLEIISEPRVKETYSNQKYYLRGHSLLYHIRKVLPDYNPPVDFKKD